MEKKEKKIDPIIEKLTTENNKLNEKNLRLQADMQNMMRNQQEEIEKLNKYDGENIITSLLVMVDNFERAINLDDANLTDELSKFLSGFKMIYGNLVNYLKSIGVCEIDALHQVFDPNIMEAITVEHVDGIEPGIVIDVFQKGYKYKDKLLRTCMVKVSE